MTEAPASMFACAKNALGPLPPFEMLPNTGPQLAKRRHPTLKVRAGAGSIDVSTER